MNRKIPQRGAAQNAAELAGSGLALAVLGGGPHSARQRMPRRCQGSVRVPPTPPPWVEPLPTPRPCLPQARSLSPTGREAASCLEGCRLVGQAVILVTVLSSYFSSISFPSRTPFE